MNRRNIAMLAIIFIIESVFYFMISNLIFETRIQQEKGLLKREAGFIKKHLETLDMKKLKDIYRNHELRVTLLDSAGNVKYDNRMEGFEGKLDNHKYRAELKNSFEGKEGFSYRYSNTLKKNLIYYSLPIYNGIVVRTADDYSIFKSKAHNLNLIIFIGLSTIFLIFFYFLYIENRIINKRLVSMRKALESENLCELYFEHDKNLKSFWHFLKKLQTRNYENQAKLEEEAEKQKEIVSSVDAGIIVLAKDGKIIMYNDEAGKNFIDSNKSQEYHILLRHMELIKLFNRIVKNNESLKEEIYVGSLKRYFICSTRYMEKRELFIITIKDITKDRELNEIQKRFITNISHELKTPLTNVKGYIAAFYEETNTEMKKKFMDTISKNVNRIEKMILDFLDTTRIENSKLLNVYPVNVDKFKEEIYAELDSIITRKNAKVDLNFEVIGNSKFINIDYEKIYIIAKNLIENAILYNDKNMPIVKFKFIENLREFVMTIEDNGVGIPDDEKEKIFERFYRINKARSGDIIGTGLGLSIVNEIVKIYGGEIKLVSEQGKGTIFTITLKK